MVVLDFGGDFRLESEEWFLDQKEGRVSVGVTIRAKPLQLYAPDQIDVPVDASGWADFSAWDQSGPGESTGVYGTIWIIGKDGKVLTDNAKTLVEVFGWDGDFGSITGEPARTKFVGTVKGDEYEGKMRFKINWFNLPNHQPGRRGASADPQVSSGLNAKYGSTFRALASSASLKPPTPPTPPKTPSPPMPAMPASPGQTGVPAQDEFGTIPLSPERPTTLPTPPATEWEPDEPPF